MLNNAVSKKILTYLKKYFGKEVAAVILYGSYAEDRETSYSDIDILVIIKRDIANWRDKRRLEVFLRRETLSIGQISPKIMTPGELLSSVENYNPFTLNIISNGKILYDTGIFKKAKKQFKNMYGKKIIKTEDGYWEVAV